MSEQPPQDAEAPSMADRLRSMSRNEITLLLMILTLSVGEGGARLLSPVYLNEAGYSAGLIGVSMSSFGVAALGARVFVGMAYRPTTARTTIIVSALASASALIAITATDSITVFAVLMSVHGFGWGVLATVLLTLVLQGDGSAKKRSAATVIGVYVGVEGIGRTGAPAVAGLLGGWLGPATGIRTHGLILLAAAIAGAMILTGVSGPDERPANRPRKQGVRKFRGAPVAAWSAFLTGLYLNTTNAVLNNFFPILGLSLGFSLPQIGLLLTSRSAVSAIIRFWVDRILKVVSFKVLFVPLYVLTAATTALIGGLTVYPAQFFLFMPNGASRGLLRVGSMARAMDATPDESASTTAALIGAGYDIGRIAGPAMGGLVASQLGLPAMFVAVPLVFLTAILPLAIRAQRGQSA